MGVLFRAAFAFAAALYLLNPAGATVWLDDVVMARLEVRCAEGLTLCRDSATAPQSYGAAR